MTRSSKDPYGKYGLYGTPAYDFKNNGKNEAGDYGRADKPKEKLQKNTGSFPSPARTVAAVLCIVLLFSALISRSGLVALSDETVAIRQEIAELLDQQLELKIQHAMAFSLQSTEEYAVDVLGMQKPTAEQIRFVEVESGESKGNEESKTNNAWNLRSVLREYFLG